MHTNRDEGAHVANGAEDNVRVELEDRRVEGQHEIAMNRLGLEESSCNDGRSGWIGACCPVKVGLARSRDLSEAELGTVNSVQLLLRNLVEIRQELRLAHLQRCRDLCTVL